MAKAKMSGPALVMNAVIYISAILCVLCFTLYYGEFYKSPIALWTGVVTLTVFYQLELRILLGKLNGYMRVNYKQWLYRELPFERRLYEILKIRSWRGKVLTYNPELFTLHDHTMEEIANTMAKVELDHWANVVISISMLLFALAFGAFPIFLTVAIVAILFDGQFIIVQRYNRPRVIKVIELQNKKRLKVKA